MTFNEIFEHDGLYLADDFERGACLEVKNGTLYLKTFEHPDDMMPKLTTMSVSKNLLSKEYREIFTRQAVFGDSISKNKLRQLFGNPKREFHVDDAYDVFPMPNCIGMLCPTNNNYVPYVYIISANDGHYVPIKLMSVVEELTTKSPTYMANFIKDNEEPQYGF